MHIFENCMVAVAAVAVYFLSGLCHPEQDDDDDNDDDDDDDNEDGGWGRKASTKREKKKSFAKLSLRIRGKSCVCVQCTSCSIISRPRGAIPHHTAGLTQTPTKQQQEQQQQQHNIYRPIPITQTFISSNVKCNTSKTCTHCLACRACHICLLVLPPSIFPAFCIQFSQNIPVPFAALSLSYLLVSHPHPPSIYPRATFHSLVLTLRLSPSVCVVR